MGVNCQRNGATCAGKMNLTGRSRHPIGLAMAVPLNIDRLSRPLVNYHSTLGDIGVFGLTRQLGGGEQWFVVRPMA